MATYPINIATLINPNGNLPLGNPSQLHSSIETRQNEEIIAIETELGLNPKSIFGSVALRLDNIENNFSISSHYTGFPDKVSAINPSSLSWVDGVLGATRTLTISPSGTTFDIYIDGMKYSVGTLTSQIEDVNGLYWFWITVPGGTPQLNSSTTHPGFGSCLVATVYWNTSTDKGILSDERHWMGRDRWLHEYLHETCGARYFKGGVIVPTNITFSISECEFYDEDIEHILPESTVCKVVYHNGSSMWEFTDNSTTLYKLNGSSMQYNNGNSLANVSNNRYIAMWIFATNNVSTPFTSIIGNREDINITNARNNNVPESLALDHPLSAELKLLYRVIYLQSGSTPTYVETADYRNVSNTPITNYVPTDHSTLTKLDFDNSGHYGNLTEPNYIATFSAFRLTDSTTSITKDVSNNLTFTDANAGSVTLTNLRKMRNIWIIANGITEGNLTLSDATNWNCQYSFISSIKVNTNSNDWNLWLCESSSFSKTDINSRQLAKDRVGNFDISVNREYNSDSNNVYLIFEDVSGSQPASIYIVGTERRHN